jgi:hypothetical protein
VKLLIHLANIAGSESSFAWRSIQNSKVKSKKSFAWFVSRGGRSEAAGTIAPLLFFS